MGAVSLAMGFALLGMIQERTGARQTILPAQEQQAESQLEEQETAPQPTPEPVRQVLTGEDRQTLNDFLETQTGVWAVWLKDLETGKTYTYNETYAYYPASLLKAPFVYWLCLRADAGEIDLEGTWFTNEWKGTLAGTPWEEYDQKNEIPAMAVIYLAVSRSDNTAVDRLDRAWPTENEAFARFLTQMGFTYPDTCVILEGIQGMMTVQDAGKIMETLWYYFGTNAPHAASLQQAFLDADHEMLYIPEDVEAAKKYGSWDYAFHDMAIVYGEYPYILCVMTDQGSSTVDYPPEVTQGMQTLGQMVWDMLEEP